MGATHFTPIEPEPIERLNDGTIKAHNVLNGTEVWTVPGRGKRPLAAPAVDVRDLTSTDFTHTCAFCSGRYLETPPEKSRLVLGSAKRDNTIFGDSAEEHSGAPVDETASFASPRPGNWQRLDFVAPGDISATTAEFRRIPNLFEIVSFDFWAQNHGHAPAEGTHRRMAEYLSTPTGYDHVMQVASMRLRAGGMTDLQIAKMPEEEFLRVATAFFAGGHDLIVGRRHFIDGAVDSSQLASAGTLSVAEHREFFRFTTHTMKDLYSLHPSVKYVVAFQNWLRPAGASFDHLHKQVVALDEYPLKIRTEAANVRARPELYHQLLNYAAHRSLLVAANEHAVAFADFGHRFPAIAVWPLGQPRAPWEYSLSQQNGISDVLHAAHAATGANVPCNEEWYYAPPSMNVPLRTRILLKWRVNTLAGFEGGTGVFLNTIDPWSMRDQLLEKLVDLRSAGAIAPPELLAIGADVTLPVGAI